MNLPKCTAEDYIQFLIATPRSYSCSEAAKVSPIIDAPPAHDAFTRILYREEPNSDELWREVEPLINKAGGILVIDDSTLDKPYARQIDLVNYHWSGKHHATVQGINLITLLWTDGDSYIPCDYRIYNKSSDNLTKNDHFRAMLNIAQERDFTPSAVVFDSWYGSIENLKLIKDLGWDYLTRLKSNRLINPDGTRNRAINTVNLLPGGQVVSLKGVGLVRAFQIVATNGDMEYWATNNFSMSNMTRQSLAERGWMIEVYHRNLKQTCGVERCQARGARAQKNHIGFSIRAFIRLERFFFRTGISEIEAKARIVRNAVRDYLTAPLYILPIPATA
ncbi:transposase [Gammaproteobacteria bacterium]